MATNSLPKVEVSTVFCRFEWDGTGVLFKKINTPTGVSTWEPLNTFFQDTPQDVADHAWKHNLLGNPHWKHAQDHTLNLPKPTMIADVDDETELIDGATLDHDSAIIDPMDQTASAAKAANATECF